MPASNAVASSAPANSAMNLTIATADRHAPGFARSVVERQILTPLDLERATPACSAVISSIRGMALNQLFSARPMPGHADYPRPARGLYRCSAGAHPAAASPAPRPQRRTRRWLDLRGITGRCFGGVTPSVSTGNTITTHRSFGTGSAPIRRAGRRARARRRRLVIGHQLSAASDLGQLALLRVEGAQSG